jgi:hypothetical protein
MIKLNYNSRRFEVALDKKAQAIKGLPAASLAEFQALTPKQTGNARRQTKLEGGTRIHADYEYATRLDAGSSKQAPSGMTRPFAVWFKKQLKKIKDA